MAGYLRGIDVSNNNGAIDWAAVAASGIGFAICKVSEGIAFRDSWLAENWGGCKLYGLGRGGFHFARPSRFGPEAEANWFLASIATLYGPLEVGDILALDLEDPYAVGDLSDWTIRWLRHVEAEVGYKPLVYTSPAYADEHNLANVPEIGDFGSWLASWGVPTPPPAPAPWSFVAIHQIGIAPAGWVPGVTTDCDVDRFNGSSLDQLKLYGKPAGVPQPMPPGPEPAPPTPAPAAPTVAFNPGYPSSLQDDEWSCAPTSTDWAMRSLGRTPAPSWVENDMVGLGYVTQQYGLMDHTGSGIVEWVGLPDASHYGADGFYGSNQCPISFDEFVAQVQAEPRSPLLLGLPNWGGPGYGHWTGVRGYDGSRQVLMLANPATGMSYGQVELDRAAYESRAGNNASLVRVTHPDLAPATAPEPEPPEPEPEPEPPPTSSTIGSGLLEMMAADGTQPAQTNSAWLPPGANPAEAEACFGENGVLYVWLFAVGRGFRYPPS